MPQEATSVADSHAKLRRVLITAKFQHYGSSESTVCRGLNPLAVEPKSAHRKRVVEDVEVTDSPFVIQLCTSFARNR